MCMHTAYGSQLAKHHLPKISAPNQPGAADNQLRAGQGTHDFQMPVGAGHQQCGGTSMALGIHLKSTSTGGFCFNPFRLMCVCVLLGYPYIYMILYESQERMIEDKSLTNGQASSPRHPKASNSYSAPPRQRPKLPPLPLHHHSEHPGQTQKPAQQVVDQKVWQ